MDQFEDLFSLEDDDCSQLFIAQEPKENIVDLMEKSANESSNDGSLFLNRSVSDFASPCVSLIGNKNVTVYSDISDDELELDKNSMTSNE